jgi:hypothetical protein
MTVGALLFLLTYKEGVRDRHSLVSKYLPEFAFLLLWKRRGPRILRPLQAVRQLLSVILEFLLFRFKDFIKTLDTLFFIYFCLEIELSDDLFRVGGRPQFGLIKKLHPIPLKVA